MIIITRDTTEDKWIKHRLYDTTTGIRYSFEISQKEGYAPQYDNIASPVHLIIEHPATPQGDEFTPTIVYPGIEAIDFLRQLIQIDLTLEDAITHMIDEALHHHQSYYENIPESKAALDQLHDIGEYTLNIWQPIKDSGEWNHIVQITKLKDYTREYYTNGELIRTVHLDTTHPLSQFPSSYSVADDIPAPRVMEFPEIPSTGKEG